MNNYLIISKRVWDKKNFSNLGKKFFFFKEINKKIIKKINPKIIFFIHWSKKISKDIYTKNLCIQFHASDLPKFRGGSPIQNQILSNIKNTKISAFKVSRNLDAGPICLKEKLNLDNDINVVFRDMEKKSLSMIKKIAQSNKIRFYAQRGKISVVKRRRKSDSNLINKDLDNIEKISTFLKANSANNYPKAFINLGKYKLYISSFKKYKNNIQGKYEIRKK